jgi:homoserine dehydrogenase
MREPELAIALVGFGNVARRFLKLLDEVADRLDFTWRLVAIATRHHGSVVDPEGVDARRAVAHVEASQSLDRLDPAPRERSGIDVVRQVTDELVEEANDGQLVVIETTVRDIDAG